MRRLAHGRRVSHGRPKADWDLVQRTLVATYAKTYSFHWSLADWKYSGARLPLSSHRLSVSLSLSLCLPACLLVTAASFDCRHFDDDQEKSSAFVHHLHMLDVRHGSSGSLRPSKSQMASGGWQLHLVVIALDIPIALRSKCCRDESSASPPEDQQVSAHDPGCTVLYFRRNLLRCRG